MSCLGRTLVAILFPVLLSGPAIADRHCAPVMEAYWRARAFLLQEDQSCTEILARSNPDFHEAVAQARICGFISLHDHLQSLLFGDGADGESCEARVERILEFSPELQAIIENHHY